MKKLAVIIIALFSAAAFVSAQQKQRVAVLPSVGDLDPQRLILLTDKVRELATQNLPMENFNILKQDVITKMIGEEELYRSCKEGVCIGDLAKKTDANYGARCDVVKLDDGLVLKFELYSVNEEAIFETFIADDVKDFRGMFAVLEARLPDVFKKMADASDRDKAREQQRQEAKPVQQAYEETPKPPQVIVVEHKWVDESGGMPRILQNRISMEFSYGFAYLFSNSYSYTYYSQYSDAAYPPVSASGSGGGLGMYGHFDLKYFEAYTKMVIFMEADSGNGMPFLPALGVEFLLKYPFVLNAVPVKVTPILGFGFITVNDVSAGFGFILGGRIDVGISRISYLCSEYLHDVGFDDGRRGGMSLKAGGGLDIAWGKKKKAFLRTELLYNWLSAYNPEYEVRDELDVYERRVDGKSAMHYVEIRAGIGYKWGGVKKVPVEVVQDVIKAK